MRKARLITAVAVACAWTTTAYVQQAPVAPQGGTPATSPAPAPAPAPAARQGGPARGGFTPFTRELASQDQILRGRALYDTNCASCHAADLRGSVDGKNPNLLRSGLALRDAAGELIGPKIAAHSPRITLAPADSLAIANFLHSALSVRGGRGLAASELNVLVGDARAGEATFGTLCGSCHSATGDMKGIASKFQDARALQNGWVAGTTATFAAAGGGARGGGAGAGNPATVTLANGTQVKGTLVRKDAFLVVITLPDGTRRSFARTDGVPKVDVEDRGAAHKAMLLKLAFEDPDNSKMHNITAYLWTLK